MQSKSTFLDNVFLDANLAPLTKIIQVQMMFCLKCWCTWLLNLTFSLCRVLACFITGLLIGCGKKGKLCSKKGPLYDKLCDFFKADFFGV